MKLMMPLAWLRKRDGVMSGMRAITGERNTAMERFIRIMTSIINPRRCRAVTQGMNRKKTNANTEPTRM
jgi:hypothetical protein